MTPEAVAEGLEEARTWFKVGWNAGDELYSMARLALHLESELASLRDELRVAHEHAKHLQAMRVEAEGRTEEMRQKWDSLREERDELRIAIAGKAYMGKSNSDWVCIAERMRGGESKIVALQADVDDADATGDLLAQESARLNEMYEHATRERDQLKEENKALREKQATLKHGLIGVEVAEELGSEYPPTAAYINRLPERLRAWVAELETRCDPAGDLRALRLAQDENRMLRRLLTPPAPPPKPEPEKCGDHQRYQCSAVGCSKLEPTISELEQDRWEAAQIPSAPPVPQVADHPYMDCESAHWGGNGGCTSEGRCHRLGCTLPESSHSGSER